MRAAAASAGFVRELETDFALIGALLADTRAAEVELVVLPEAAMGGYLGSLGEDALCDGLPPALRLDGPEVARLARMAGELVVCAGLAEASPDGASYNTAVCVSGDGVLGSHRKVHQPLQEGAAYAAGSSFASFDTPVGRLGMAICYDKAFPESGRSLALDGAEVICLLSAWPTSRTNAAPVMAEDRQARMFDLYDAARAVENQVFVVSANQWGTFGSMTLLGRAKCVSPSGEVLAGTGCAPGLAVADLDLSVVHRSRSGGMNHLRDRRPDAYRTAVSA
ncbi:MAG: carbon-nitrogen hydrolase family protein [Mycobacteriales bacterium]